MRGGPRWAGRVSDPVDLLRLRQPQTHAALVTRIVDFGYDVQQAIEAPRWLMGRTWGTASQDLSLEGRIPDPVVDELRRRGQPVKPLTDWNDNMGHAQAIRVNAAGLGSLDEEEACQFTLDAAECMRPAPGALNDRRDRLSPRSTRLGGAMNRDEIKGKVQKVKSTIKEQTGKAERTAGQARETYGKVRRVAGKTLERLGKRLEG